MIISSAPFRRRQRAPMNALVRTGVLVAGCALISTAALAQPQILNAQVVTRTAASGLDRELRSAMASQSGPLWAGYSVPAIPGDHSMCCGGSYECCGTCKLERDGSTSVVSAGSNPVSLESDRQILVLYRIEGGAVQKIRTFSYSCQLDAGGLPFYWITGVRPTDSVAWLVSYATSADEGRRRLADSAVTAIAFHGDPEADRALESFVSPAQAESLRERTSFWLGNARGKAGYNLLRRMMQEDPSERVRDKVVFALTQSREPEALDTLIEAARADKSSHVRGQALFWLAQKAGKKAEAAITAAIENDPETEIKKRAVFALSQLPKDDGVPLLIEVAKTNKNPAVRKQAMFWLGQSKDPRALAFFEQILKN